MGAVTKFIIATVVVIFSLVIMSIAGLSYFTAQKATNVQLQQATSQFDVDSTNMLNTCMTAISIGDLNNCKSAMSQIQNMCENPQTSSLQVCSDPRLGQFLSTVNGKIAYAENVISNDASNLIVQCVHLISLGENDQECISDMQNIQQECITYNVDYHMSVCSDPRINEILTGSIHSQLPNQSALNLTQGNQNSSSLIQSTNQYTLSYLDSCMQATDTSVIQSCTQTAKQMLSYCNNISSVGIGQICSDPRLKQLANMGQSTNSTEPLSPSQTTINATILNNLNTQMQNILNECTNPSISSSSTCINAINEIKQDCSNALEKTYSSYFTACSDPILQ